MRLSVIKTYFARRDKAEVVWIRVGLPAIRTEP